MQPTKLQNNENFAEKKLSTVKTSLYWVQTTKRVNLFVQVEQLHMCLQLVSEERQDGGGDRKEWSAKGFF